jgi:outer membrane protein TolC
MQRSIFVLWLGLFCLIVSFYVAQGHAGEADVYTLDEAIEEAMTNNNSLQAVMEQRNQALFERNQARAEFLPKLRMSYGVTRLDEPIKFRSTISPGGRIEVSSRDNYEWRGRVTQPLFTGFGLISAYKLTELGIDSSDLEIQVAKLDLALQVKEAYFGILIADREVNVAKASVEAFENQVKVSQSFYDVGVVPINDVLRSEVELANAKQDLLVAQNAAQVARSRLNTVLARPVNSPVNAAPIQFEVTQRDDFEVYVRQALANRPEVQLVDNRIQQVDQEIRLTESEYYPEVALTYDYIKEGDDWRVQGGQFQEANRWQVSIVATWLFFEWGKTRYAVKQQESLQQELFQTRMALEKDIRLQLKEAVLALIATEENIPVQKKAVEQGEENLRVNEERYKAQVTTINEVLVANSLLARARSNFFQTIYNHVLAKARLDRALGTY